MDGEIKAVIIIIVVIAIFGINVTQVVFSSKNEEIIGSVTNVDFKKDWMTVTFDNNDIYNIYYPGPTMEYDFTDNSTLRIDLRQTSFWLTPNTNNVWSISSVIKVPE